MPDAKKKATPKRKVSPSMEITEDDVDDILNNIVVSSIQKKRNIIGGKKIPTNMHVARMDKVSFHYEESMLKWKYVYKKRISPERELSKEDLKCEDIVELLKDA